MPENDHQTRRLRFSVFEVDLNAGELRKHGMRIRIQEQPFQLLATLIEHAGEVVSREELQKKLWTADTFVDFDHGLNKAINKIREALGDSAESPRFVETVSRRGYRFLAEVQDVDAPSVLRPASAIPSQFTAEPPVVVELAGKPAIAKRHSLSLAWKVSALMLLVLVAFVGAWKFHSWKRPSLVIRSLAVLPLESLSSDASQDYFADGMTDELISDLGQISALRVISRTSVMTYKHAHKPLPQIARELNVDAVVEGTVVRSGDQVRITAQLIQAVADKLSGSRPVTRHDFQLHFGPKLHADGRRSVLILLGGDFNNLHILVRLRGLRQTGEACDTGRPDEQEQASNSQYAIHFISSSIV